MKVINVVAAIIFNDKNQVLATQRGYGEFKDWWEFPGGKIEEGESERKAIEREIYEEMNAKIEVIAPMTTIDYDYPNFHLHMTCFECRLNSEFTLLEHEDGKWLKKDELDSVKWLPADLTVVDLIKQKL